MVLLAEIWPSLLYLFIFLKKKKKTIFTHLRQNGGLCRLVISLYRDLGEAGCFSPLLRFQFTATSGGGCAGCALDVMYIHLKKTGPLCLVWFRLVYSKQIRGRFWVANNELRHTRNLNDSRTRLNLLNYWYISRVEIFFFLQFNKERTFVSAYPIEGLVTFPAIVGYFSFMTEPPFFSSGRRPTFRQPLHRFLFRFEYTRGATL